MSESSGLKTVTHGDYAYTMDCQSCGKTVHAAITLGSQLTVNENGSWLRGTFTTKRVEHNCNALEQPSMLDNDGQVIPLNG